MYHLYVIGLTEDLNYPYDKCYIGVTNDILNRWKAHERGEYNVGKFIRKHNLTLENMKLIFTGSDDECFELERKYRPHSNMGLNIMPGGCGGYTSYSVERNKKISKALKGAKMHLDA